jgi:hypothetical protein
VQRAEPARDPHEQPEHQQVSRDAKEQQRNVGHPRADAATEVGNVCAGNSMGERWIRLAVGNQHGEER